MLATFVNHRVGITTKTSTKRVAANWCKSEARRPNHWQPGIKYLESSRQRQNYRVGGNGTLPGNGFLATHDASCASWMVVVVMGELVLVVVVVMGEL
ncbi:hypothetical protein Pcinc_022228 [Petrolisthes cinctipes]|uniref:Uncharacterized protein n=1 Tax=Petrolisthes cinctipes TaxID=88211 RepID=A0AAE1FEI7_PETCI|nr:hypothetical protein Pcinc_022228 [Petrolisthes cinctipes]